MLFNFSPREQALSYLRSGRVETSHEGQRVSEKDPIQGSEKYGVRASPTRSKRRRVRRLRGRARREVRSHLGNDKFLEDIGDRHFSHSNQRCSENDAGRIAIIAGVVEVGDC